MLLPIALGTLLLVVIAWRVGRLAIRSIRAVIVTMWPH